MAFFHDAPLVSALAQRGERLLGEVVAPRRALDRLGQDLAVERHLDRAVEGGLVGDPDPVGGRPDDPVDLVELPGLVALGQLGVVLEHDVHALGRVVAAEDPALERRLQELDRDVLVARLLEPRIGGEDRVLEHRRAVLLPRDDVEVIGRVELAGRRVLGLEDLGVLVVDHRLGGVDLAGAEGDHVELLGDDVDVALVGRVDAGLAQPGVQLGLVAEAPRRRPSCPSGPRAW